MRTEKSLIKLDDDVELSQKQWVVGMVRRKGHEHAFLLIEGINESDEDILYRADLFIDGSKPIYRASGMASSGTALIRLKESSVKELLELHQAGGWYAQTWEISDAEAVELIKDVEKSTEDDIKYCLMGDGSIYKGSRSSGKVHNCVTWCIDRLRSIEISVHDSWTDQFIVRPSDKVPGDDVKGKEEAGTSGASFSMSQSS